MIFFHLPISFDLPYSHTVIRDYYYLSTGPQIKLWSPIKAESDPDFSSLLKTMKKNGKERERESESGDGSIMDGQMLWFLMQHLRRNDRRRRRMRRRTQEGDGDDDDDEDDDFDDAGDGGGDTSEEEEEEEGDDVTRVVDCNPS